MKIKVSDADTDLLNLLVCRAIYPEYKLSRTHLWLESDGPYVANLIKRFSTQWGCGGPLIKSYRIDCISDPNGVAGWLGRNWVDGRGQDVWINPTHCRHALPCCQQAGR